tara:strand:- start:139 stop:372 length:234 start_codon:yes stop_codon:yes gene_type:complete
MSKAPKKKPTMQELKDVINGILVQMSRMQDAILQLDSMVYGYLDYKGESKKYRAWLEEQIKEQNGEREGKRASIKDY